MMPINKHYLRSIVVLAIAVMNGCVMVATAPDKTRAVTSWPATQPTPFTVGDRIVTSNKRWMTPIRLPLVGWDTPKYYLQTEQRPPEAADAVDLPDGTEIVVERFTKMTFVPSVDVGCGKSLHGSIDVVGRITSGTRRGDTLILASDAN